MAMELLKSNEQGDFGFGPYVQINQENDVLTIKFQKGPIREVGENGTQIDTLIEIGREIIDSLNRALPCRENALAITKMDEALLWLWKRRADREKRRVEGRNEA